MCRPFLRYLDAGTPPLTQGVDVAEAMDMEEIQESAGPASLEPGEELGLDWEASARNLCCIFGSTSEHCLLPRSSQVVL